MDDITPRGLQAQIDRIKKGICCNQISGYSGYSGATSTPYIAQTGTYAAQTTDYTIDCTSGTFTVTLPTAVGVSGKIYNIKNSGIGVITLATTSGQTIDGSVTQTINPTNNLTVQSTGANWILL